MAAALLILSGGTVAQANGAPNLALLPFENVSGSIKGSSIIMPMIDEALKAKGYRMVRREEIESFLLRRRIRNTGMISRRYLDALRQKFAVDLVMVGSVDLYHESEENPQWGISSRVISASKGTVLWAKSAGLTGDDFTTVLGLGTIRSGERLAKEVVTLLLRGFPSSGETFRKPVMAGVPIPSEEDELTEEDELVRRGIREKGVYRSPLLDSAGSWRVAVLPFENVSERKGAGRILTDIFTTALFRHGRFQVVDPGEAVETLIAVGKLPYGGIDFKTLADLGKRTGIDAFFVGTLYGYNEGLKSRAATEPEVELDARMLHAESGRILWLASHQRGGDEYQIALDFGTIRSMVPLALTVVREMLDTL
jgi:TolB-like protein